MATIPFVMQRIREDLAHRDRSECWVYWTASRYPAVRHEGRMRRVHEVVLEGVLGRPIAKGMQGLHTCDNNRCYNPEHLYEGSPTQNVDDARRRGRMTVGERHPKAKLTEDQVRAIRRDHRLLREIAVEYGVSVSLIRRVRLGLVWRHVPLDA